MISVHFLGIAGSGASAIAAIAQAQGFKVTGCDKNPFNEFTTRFKKDDLYQGHSKDHLKNVDILAVTPAVFSLDPDNEEIKEARSRRIPVLTWQQFMGQFLEKDKFVIAVCGTHGKSTTTAMIANMMEDAGIDPTVELGAIVPRWGNNFRIGKSKYFVTEADEFNNNFLVTHPNLAVITNIDMDHPEFFKDFEEYKDSFEQFLNQVKNGIVANLSDPDIADILKYVVKATGVQVLDFTRSEFNLKLKVPGEYNQFNAAAAFQVGLILGINPQTIRQSLENYTGIGRRFEYLGNYKNTKIYSDFGHHPQEIKVTMEAAREKFPKDRLIMIFQPHMFSRTKALFNEFVEVLRHLPVDKIYIADIYPSREIDTGIVNSKQLVDAVHKENVSYLGSLTNLPSFLNSETTDGDIIFLVGAGNIDEYARKQFLLQKV